MCGIAGYVGDFLIGLVRQMSLSQSHRGPDGTGLYEDAREQAAFAHNRLAILDLSDAAAQPMQSVCGRYLLTYNGEIYNYGELRESIGVDSALLRSSGDTEVLLNGLIKWGPDFVPRLNGIFAFGFWDRVNRQLLLARDQLGVKPLYYCEPRPGSVLFASEIKGLLCHPSVKTDIDPLAIQQHLGMCHASGSRTAIRGIYRLAPGSVMSWGADSRRPMITRYWQPDFNEHHGRDRREVVDALRAKIRKSVERQLISDVPVGAFLSGGLDSSLLVHHAAAINPTLACFTNSPIRKYAKLDDFIDDGPYARAVATELGVPLTIVPVHSSSSSMLPDLLYYMDEPIADPAIINCYLISRQARELGIKVLLSGQGADELFGGYPRYRAMQFTRFISAFPTSLQRLAALSQNFIPGARRGLFGPTLRRTRRLLAAAAYPPLQQFLEFCCQTPANIVESVLSPALRNETNGNSPYSECLASMESSKWAQNNRFLERDLTVYLPNHNLMYTDKMGMAAGVEIRVPFLDIELVNYVNHIPYSWKVTLLQLKKVLRDAARGTVSDEIIYRRKAGFGAPFRGWLRDELGPLWDDISSKQSIMNRGWFSYDTIISLRERSQAGAADFYLLQWAIITLELWARRVIDGRKRVPIESNQFGITVDAANN